MPAGQTAQEEEATEAEKVPAAHAAQSMNWSCMATTVAASAKYVPATQLKHADNIGDGAYLPELHTMQTAAPVAD